jgi:hypothetical protein
MREPCSVQDLKQALRNPVIYGGYTLAFYTADGERLCPGCIKNNFRQVLKAKSGDDSSLQWRVDWIDIYWEGRADYCAHCDESLPSEYGDPEGDIYS